ncbi:CPBP family intramembrane glutamic endopeptidase [Egbenema bharatensis]|uniref:CPBP family intramembrane glutamic endopeptidase n=1 Tax=Egbenema bharatensis TaxID=3463334 RepID=UPI003A88B9DD
MTKRWGRVARWAAPVRILVFLGLLGMCWLPLAAPIALLVPDDNTVTIITMSLLFVAFLVFVPIWGRSVHGEARPLRRYGLVGSKQNGLELLAGLVLGTVSLLAMFGVQAGLGWLEWRSAAPSLPGVILEGLLVSLGVGLAEELVFRGWILDELDRDYSPRTALWSNSLLFAALHFLKPIPEMIRTFPQFPGLVLLGLALVWARRSTVSAASASTHKTAQPPTAGRLGLPIGLHAGLVWGYYIMQVGELIQYTNRVPVWLTGIDGNPLAGAIGLLFLAGITLLIYLMYRRSHSRIPG